MSNIFADWCDKYTGMGMNVTPLNGKRPFLSEWQLANHDYDDLTDKYPKCNIGLICGELSGVIAIDIDLKDDELINRVLNIIPPSEYRKRGAKGLTLFYRYQGEVNGKLFFNGETAIELLSTGNQTVLPPSIHPDTKKPYTWDYQSLLDVNAYDLPLFDHDRVWPRLQHLFGDKKSTSKAKFNDISPALGRSPHGSFLRLQHIASRLTKDRMPFDKAVKYLIEKDIELHSPHGGITYFGQAPLNVIHARKFLSGLQETFIRRQIQNNLPLELPIDEVDQIETFLEKKEKIPSITKECMPSVLWDYVENQARINETSIDYVFMSSLISFVLPLGDKLTVMPKRNSSFQWRPKLSFMLVGQPSVRKSPALGSGLRIFQASIDTMKRIRENEIDEAMAKIKSTEAVIRKLREDTKKQSENKELFKEIILMEKALKKLKSNPLLKSWILNNATIQAIMKECATISGAYLQHTDELAGWLDFIDQKNQAGARGEFLTLMNQGMTSYTISRKDENLSMYIDYAHVSLIGTIQPQPAKRFISTHDGLMQRFQIVYPDYVPSIEMVDEKENQEYFKALVEKVFNLLTMSNDSFFEVNKSGLGVLRFDDDAYTIYSKLVGQINLTSSLSDDDMQAFLSKSMTFFYTLCAVYYYLEFKPDQERRVNKRQATMARETMLVFIEHMKRIYKPEEFINSGDNVKVNEIDAIIETMPKEFNASMIKKINRALNIDAITEHLNQLTERGELLNTNKKAKGSRYFIFSKL